MEGNKYWISLQVCSGWKTSMATWV